MNKRRTIVFNHLGFPIKLINCPHVFADGALVPDVPYKKLEEFMFMALPFKPTRLSGAELKFIRHHLEKTREQFAKWLEDSSDASTVSRWEKEDLRPTGMLDSMERSLRLQLIVHILKQHRRKTVPVQVLEKITASIATQKSVPLELKMPIPTTFLRKVLSA